MNNKNFDNLNNIEVPQSWIDNAINIPNVVPKKKPLIFPKINRYLAAVACLVLVCTVSLVIVLNVNRNIVPVKPLVSDNDKDNNKATEPTNEGVVPPTAEDSSDEPITQVTTEPTDSDGNGVPTEAPTDGADTEPSDPNNEPTEVPTAPTDEPQVDPTIPPTSEPTDEPTYKPTEPPWVDPWEPSLPPTEELEPETGVETEPPSGYPSSGYPPSGSDVFIQCDVTKVTGYLESGQINIFCNVMDPDGNMLGNHYPYSFQKIVTIYQVKNGVAYGAYSIKNTYNITKHGKYTALFYDINGKDLGVAYYLY